MAEPAKGTITLDQASKLLKCTKQWVMKLRRDGWISQPYTLLGVVHGYIDYRNDDERRNSKSAAGNETRDAKLEEIRLRIAEKEALLQKLAREEASALLDTVLGPLKADIISIPARVTKDIALRRKLESEFYGAFAAAHRRLEAEIARAAEDGAPGQAVAAAVPRDVGGGKQGLSAKRGRARAS